MSKAVVTIGVQAGDIESSEATRPAFIGLRKQLANHCTGSYSPQISEFAIVLRVCGSLWRFEGEGVQKLRLNLKEAYITTDFVIPESRWRGVPLSEIKVYLAAAALEALQSMLGRLVKAKVPCDCAKLLGDARSAASAFLAATPDS
jgi:hypothetical protein